MNLPSMSCRAPASVLALLVVALLAPMGGCAASGGEARRSAGARTYAFWPLAPDEPRVQFVRSFAYSGDVNPSKPSGFERLVFGEESQQVALINKPYGVEMRDGKIFVCDIRNASVAVLDLRKKQMRLIGVTGIQRLSNPVDVATADDGTIYVADNQRDAVLVYDASERYRQTISHKGLKPVGLAVHGDRLYVCNLTAQMVEIMDRRTGEVLGTIGSVGDEDGQFRVPLGIDTDAEGNVYVSDMMRCRVQKFSPEGKLLSAMGTLGDYAGSFARPKQLSVDAEGIVYVVDAAFQNVQMFDGEHQLLMSFGAAGEFPGAMNLPAGICTLEDGLELFQDDIHPGFEARRLILVTNQFGPQKVSVYALGSRRQSWALADLHATAAAVSAGVGINPEGAALQAPVDEEPEPEPRRPGGP